MSNFQIKIEATDPIDELSFEPVSPKYRSVQIVGAVIAYSITAALALLMLFVSNPGWCIAIECVIAVSCIFNLLILRKAYLFKGYALREHDITYRSGIIFPKTTSIPFSKIQQVSISQNPVSKFFDMYAIDIVNGAQGLSSVSINGLSKEKAEGLKNIITNRLNDNND